MESADPTHNETAAKTVENPMISPNTSYFQVRHSARMFLLLFAGLLLLAGGCQQESEEITPIPTDKVIRPNSTVASLIERISLNDGSPDNILDNASCTALVLPVTVLVNGQTVQINSKEDLKQVERIWDELTGDDDAVVIQFPVTLTLADHSTVTLPNEDALEALVESCTEGGGDDDIECIDFKYPFTVSVYDSKNQLSDVVVINTDAQLFTFFENLDTSELVGIQFPIIVTHSDGSEVTITGNSQLEDLIEGASDDCDEDDDNDFEDDDVDTSALSAILISGSWEVYFFLDETDKTSLFAPYTFTFSAGDAASATSGGTNVPGVWKPYGDDGSLELVFDFGETAPFILIKEDWEVATYSNTVIELTDEVGDPDARRLTFRKI